MKLVFRIDDVSLYMDWAKLEQMVEIFQKNKIKPLLGVIPDNQDAFLREYAYNPNGWSRILRLKQEGWLIAQHGFKHLYLNQNTGILGINNYSEFAGVAYEKQYEMLLAGKQILDQKGLETNIFMAPAHSFDRDTLKALKALDFKCVTDGYSLFPYTRCGLKFIPCQSSRPIKVPFGVITVCLHPNTMSESSFENLGIWITNNRKSIYDYDEVLNYPSLGFLSKLLEKFVLLLKHVKNRYAKN